MALNLEIDIEVNDGAATAKLAAVEHAVKRVERASAESEAPVTRMTKALTGTGAAADRVSQSSQTLENTTRKLSGALSAESEEWRKGAEAKLRAALGMDDLTKRSAALNNSMVALTATRAASTAAVTAGTMAIGSLAVVAAGELAFLYKASQAYVTKSGILDEHAESIAGVKDAWDDLLFASGQALVGSGQNFNGWINLVNVGLRILGGEIVRRIEDFRILLGLVQMVGDIPAFWSGGGWQAVGAGMPTPANATRDIDGNLTAYGRMQRSQEVAGMLDRQNGGDFARPSGREAERLFEASERERIAEEKRRAAERKRLEDIALRLQAAKNKQMAEDILGWATPRVDHMWDWVSNGTSTGIGLSQRDMLEAGVSEASIRAAYDAGQGMFTRPRGDDIWALPPQTITAGSLFPGGHFMGIVPRRDQSGLSSLLGGGFGSSAQFGNQLSATILQAITGGGSMLGGIGSLIGGNAGGGLAKLLTGGAGIKLGGFAGGALNAVLPGIGALAGPALQWLTGKMFGPTAYETRERQAGSDISGMIGGLEGQFGGADGTAFLADKLGIKWNDARQWRGAGSVDPLSGIVNQIQGVATKGLNDILKAALETGAAFPAALQPALESLIRMGGLTQENANLLRGLPAAGIPSMAEITAAADVLGVSVGALGDRVKQIGLTETAEEAAQAWLTLERAGADMGAVAAASAEQMQGYVNQAIQYGFSLPAALRPAVETMRDLGLISGDLEQIEWAKPLTQSVDELVNALKELVATLRGDVSGAIDEINGREITVRGKVDFDRSGYAPIDEGGDISEGMPIMHRGGEVPVLAQSGEYMMRRSAVAQYGRSFMSAVNNGTYQGGGSGPREVIIPVTVQMMDGRVLAEVVARETLQ